MPLDRSYHLLTHLTLALAGVCLTWAETPYLLEMQPALLLYLGLLLLSWRLAGRRALPAWAANLLGLGIAAGAAVWIAVRVSNQDDAWTVDVPLAAAVIPYLGLVLMALLLVRLFRPPAPGDFWTLQGLGLLMAALGCVLASDTLFTVFLLPYLGVAFCALAAHERHAQIALARIHAEIPLAGSPGAPLWRNLRAIRWRWLLFSLRWSLAVSVLVVPLVWLMPQVEGPEWEPLSRFGVPSSRSTARMGFSDEIDVTRVGRLEPDASPAFSVRVTDPQGRPVRGLSADQRWRGVVLDRYDEGVWRSELSWTDRGAKAQPDVPLDETPGVVWLAFQVPRQAGWLFLADPVRLGPAAGVLPVSATMPRRRRSAPLFSEVSGTVVPATYLTEAEYRYIQSVPFAQPRDRYPAPRLAEPYLRKLVINPTGGGLSTWALDRRAPVGGESAFRQRTAARRPEGALRVGGGLAAHPLGAGGANDVRPPGAFGRVHVQPGGAPRGTGPGPGDGFPGPRQAGLVRALRLRADAAAARAGRAVADRQGLSRRGVSGRWGVRGAQQFGARLG